MSDVTVQPECQDPFHFEDGNNGEAYTLPPMHGWAGVGFRCPTCGFQTVTIDTYIPVDKPCSACGKTFEGEPPVDQPEKCDDCLPDPELAIEELIAQSKACAHDVQSNGICSKCGTGRFRAT